MNKKSENAIKFRKINIFLNKQFNLFSKKIIKIKAS